MTFALIPAAGKSTRMGRPKLALALGDRSVLDRVIGAMHQAGVGQTLVVVGPHVPELVPLAQAAGSQALLLAAETLDMRATIEQGLRWAEEHWHPRTEDTWLLVPGDHPTLEALVVRQLLQAHAEHPNYSIVVPTFEGKRGHPTLIAWRHVEGIRSLPADQGLNAYLRRHTAATLQVPLADAGILCDMDTPEEYERLQRRWLREV